MRTPAALIAAAVALVVATLGGAAFAAHDAGGFELESNATNSGAAGYDWNSLFPRDSSASEIAKVFVDDGKSPPADTTYFTGGGSKDIHDITEWALTTGDVAPDKNEITNAYAVAYRSPRDTGKTDKGDLLLFFGADRYANNGDAQMGFWFFTGDVGISGLRFTGSHRVGDLLVLSHFTQGGRVDDIEVYRWVGSGGSDGPLDLIATGQECSSGLRDDRACSAVNDSPVAAPWPYEPKSGAAGTFPSGSFYEGGINVSRLAPGVECFSGYLAETRSSQSVDAQLKDLAFGPFDTCPPSPRKVTRQRTNSPRKTSVTSRPRAGGGVPLADSGPADLWLLTALGVTFVLGGCTVRARVAEGPTRPCRGIGPSRRRVGVRRPAPRRPR